MQKEALFKLSYGLFVLTSKDGDKQNGCIVNTVAQVTDTPLQISVTVNKANLTHDMILKSGLLNVSVISESADFSLFEHFGFKSGRDTDKFENFENFIISKNGVAYVYGGINAIISGEVVNTIDLGTHTQFICKVVDSFSLNEEKSMTYQYYFDNVKPKPQPKKKGYVCKICGYVYEGEVLPDDFICPLCKHPASDFEPIE
ncbi:MAG: flavin reductase [Clostridia bacterium]|nr:flavin reductase [Clostridia bacterium]